MKARVKSKKEIFEWFCKQTDLNIDNNALVCENKNNFIMFDMEMSYYCNRIIEIKELNDGEYHFEFNDWGWHKDWLEIIEESELAYDRKIEKEPKDFKVKIKLAPGVELPKRAYPTSSGVDLVCNIEGTFFDPNETLVIGTGVFLEMPDPQKTENGLKVMEAIIRPRSSASKQGILVHMGTIDNEYRGEIKICITNKSNNNYYLAENVSLAQLVFQEIIIPDIEIVDELGETARGDKGFGSTNED